MVVRSTAGAEKTTTKHRRGFCLTSSGRPMLTVLKRFLYIPPSVTELVWRFITDYSVPQGLR